MHADETISDFPLLVAAWTAKIDHRYIQSSLEMKRWICVFFSFLPEKADFESSRGQGYRPVRLGSYHGASYVTSFIVSIHSELVISAHV